MRRSLSLLLLAALAGGPHLSAHAANACTSSLPVTDPHAAQYFCAGVRPGMVLHVNSAKWGNISCGASFAFTDQNKQKYLTLPGSCFLDYTCLEDVFEELPPPLPALIPQLPTCTLAGDSELEPYYKKNGPVVRDGDDKRIGSLTYAVNKEGVDFAIVRLDPGVKLDPSVPLFGGPRRLATPGAGPEEVHVYSASLAEPGDVTPRPNARSGVLHSYGLDRAYVVTEGLLSIAHGSAVMRANGDAVGLFTGGLTIPLGWATQPFGPALARTTRHTGLRLTLLTAPLA
ncbi:MAG: hypothetical protein QOE45_1699 [Frankiaceae bacterium]|jgi:hypothetical protein|nr:hypothetical protein [Frankiaceae bacterium]